MQVESKLKCRWHTPEFQARVNEVVNVGKQTFQETSFNNEQPIKAEDLQLIAQFFTLVTPDTTSYPHLVNWEGAGSLMEHCHLSGRIAHRLSERVNKATGSSLDPYAQQAALELHDLGRTVTHSFMETDELSDILWSHIGLRSDLKELTHNAHLYWDSNSLDFDSLPIPTRISVISDVFGKRSAKDPNRLRHTDEIFEAVKAGKNKYILKKDRTRYEDELVKRLSSYMAKEEYVISNTLRWLEELGIDLNPLLDEVMNEYLREVEAK